MSCLFHSTQYLGLPGSSLLRDKWTCGAREQRSSTQRLQGQAVSVHMCQGRETKAGINFKQKGWSHSIAS